MTTVPLDRRVSVHSNTQIAEFRLSELRDRPYLVLLGEPGSGKSTALDHEAVQEGGELVTCREAMSGVSLSGSTTGYFDALDEYRTGEGGKDKLLQLGLVISNNKLGRWRLTCRAEDWRAAADLAAMRRAANNEPITVAHLLPLNEEEAQLVLEGLGETDPGKFVFEARSRGAGPFLESPLSLKLLHSALLSDGIWPRNRFELFERAIFALAHEHDPQRVTDPRPGADRIIVVAEKMCFFLLATGAHTLWRSNALVSGARANDFVPVHSLEISPDEAGFALDTAIFRGEGQSFEPVHRTVAEFLAGRFIAGKVVGQPAGHQFPLRRAIALVTGSDLAAPSELRGLYAWFAAHLSQMGDEAGAIRLIERDAATVLAYGDAATFKTAGRKAILANLDRTDPFFLSSRERGTVIGGLAADDLVPEFLAILDSEARGHLQLTVLEALTEGQPLLGMQAKLHEISISPVRSHWQRIRASEIWIRGAGDTIAARRVLLSEVAATPLDYGQVSLRANILAGIPPSELCFEEIRDLLSDLDSLPPTPDGDTEDGGSLTALMMGLKVSPRPDFFAQELIRKSADGRGQKFEVRHFLQETLASTIHASPEVDAQTLWSWVLNTRENEWSRIDDDLARAIDAWIACNPEKRELELFLALLDSSPAEDEPWVARSHYIQVARRYPSDDLIEKLIELVGAETNGKRRRRLLEVIAYTARSETLWPVWEDRIVALLKAEKGTSKFIRSLRTDPNRRWKDQEAARTAKRLKDDGAARANNIASLEPKMNIIAAGRPSEYGALRWASELYRNAVVSEKEDPLSKIEHYTNPRITSAIAEGFVQFAIHTDIKLTAEDLGRAEAANCSYHQEYVVAAGLHQAIMAGREEELSKCPPVIAIVALRQSYFGKDESRSLADWAVRHLSQDIGRGVDEILNYWNSALDGDDEDLAKIGHLSKSAERDLVSKALKRLLHSRPDLPPMALRQALSSCVLFFTQQEISELTRHAATSDMTAGARALWTAVELALDPGTFEATNTSDQIRSSIMAPNGDLAEKLDAICPDLDRLDRIRIANLGVDHQAGERDWAHSGGPSAIIRAAINRLSASSDPDAGLHLRTLKDGVDASWSLILAHAAAEHARLLRDSQFKAPEVAQIKAALADGPPANPADLLAVVMEVIERYKRTLRTGSEMPWKRYWNTDKDGAPEKPQIENEDRDRLLELLRMSLDRYGVAASLPEARRGENTRADVLLISHAGKNLPIEAKRHNNRELWTAPVEQLAGYASDDEAFGYGLYLVFWFGVEFPITGRSDGTAAPSSATELEDLLRADLPPALDGKISVVVLDVSRPQGRDKTKSTTTRKVAKNIKSP